MPYQLTVPLGTYLKRQPLYFLYVKHVRYKAKSITGKSSEETVVEQPETEEKKPSFADNIEASSESNEAVSIENNESEINDDGQYIGEEISTSEAEKSGEKHSFYG